MFRRRLCLQIEAPPHGLQLARCRLWGHLFFLAVARMYAWQSRHILQGLPHRLTLNLSAGKFTLQRVQTMRLISLGVMLSLIVRCCIFVYTPSFK